MDKPIGKACISCRRHIKHEVVKTDHYKVAGKTVQLKVWRCTNCGTEHTTRKMIG